MSRLLRIVSTALVTAGLVVLADVGLTLAWKEPVSSVYGAVQQDQAAGELDELEEEFPSRADLEQIERLRGVRAKVRALADLFADRVERGEGIGRIRIPSIDASYVLVEGTDTDTLRKGPGRYPDTRLPGQGGTVGIAGHRTTYLAPFRHIDEIEDGDRIILELPYATIVYRVQKHRIVPPSAVGIVRDRGYERVVLTACHPLYSAAKRYAIFGRLEFVSLFGDERRWVDP